MLTETQIEVAVDWWAKALVNPKFDTLGKTRGDPQADPKGAAAMSELMAADLHTNPSKEAIAQFREALRTHLQGIAEEAPDRMFGYLGVDYWPEQPLADALTAAGIEVKQTTLPWKTSMQFVDGGVKVSSGYGADWETLLEETT